MKIEFFYKSSGCVVKDSDDCLFVMNNRVYADNYHATESQEATVSFEDFITPALDDIDWRVVAA
jgi:hypothetical protein